MRQWAFIFCALALLALPFAVGARDATSGAAEAVAMAFLILAAATFVLVGARDWLDWWRDR